MSPRVWFLVSPQHQTGTTGWVPVPLPYSPGSALLCPLRPPYPGGQPGHGSGQALPAQPGSRCGRFAGCELQEGAESSYFLPKCQLPAQSGSAGLRQLPPLPPAWCGRGHGAGAPCSLTPQQGTASPHGAESPPPVPPHPEGSQGRTWRTEVGGMREGWRAWTHLRPTAPLAAHGTGAKPLESNPRFPPCLLQAPQRAPQRAVEGSRRWNWRSSPLLRLHVVSSFRSRGGGSAGRRRRAPSRSAAPRWLLVASCTRAAVAEGSALAASREAAGSVPCPPRACSPLWKASVLGQGNWGLTDEASAALKIQYFLPKAGPRALGSPIRQRPRGPAALGAKMENLSSDRNKETPNMA